MSNFPRIRPIQGDWTHVCIVFVVDAFLILAASCAPAPTTTAVRVPIVTSQAKVKSTPAPLQINLVSTGTPTATLALLRDTPAAASSLTPTGEPFPPAACGVQDITRLVDQFLDGLNKDDFVEIGSSFALDGFEEFYVGGVKGGKPYTEIRTGSRPELMDYVARRYSRHEVRKQLEPVRVFPDANRTNGVAIAFYVSRKADDIAYIQAGGKGAVNCAGPRIIRWIWDGNQLP